MSINEEDIRKSFEKDNVSKSDLEDVKGLAASLLSFIDNQDEDTKSKISEAFGGNKLDELKNLIDKD